MTDPVRDAVAVLVAQRTAAMPHAPPALVEAVATREVQQAADAGGLVLADDRAVVGEWLDADAWCGEPTRHRIVGWRHGDNAARRRVEQALGTLGAPPSTLLLLDRPCAGLAPTLRAHGLQVDSVVLVGETATARAALGPVPDVAGVRVRPGHAADAEAVVRLQRETFTENPDPCWFGANAAWLEALRRDWIREADGGDGVVLVVEDADGFAGFAQGGPARDGRWGHTAGLSLVLAPRVRGRGVSRVLHARLLDGLIDRGVRWFNGGTSNPAVLYRARRMGRRPMAWVWRVRPPHPPDRFGPFAIDRYVDGDPDQGASLGGSASTRW